MRARTASLAVALGLALLNGQARAGEEDLWIADANGCKVRNPHPRPNESVTWSGTCANGYAEGQGVLQWLLDGKPGSRYEGTLAGGKATGKGIFVSTSGARYEGDFADGKRSGKGVFTDADGARYDGDWVDNRRDGKGAQTFSDGSKYEGAWKDDKPVDPSSIVRKTYSIKQDVTGSHIARNVVSEVPVPIDKTYAELTAEEKRRVKALYESMAEDDEPPYPSRGLRPILEASEKLQRKLLVQGAMSLAVTVNAAGEATAVEVLRSPDSEMTKQMATVLMLVKYKPALCKGTPCKMQYPFRMNYLLQN